MAYIENAEQLMAKYRTELPHVRHVALLADELFVRLQGLHRLEETFRLELRLASLLHDIGHYVGEKGHHAHSAYLILHDESLKAWDPERKRRVAYAALNHRKKRELSLGEQDPENRSTADALAALLRIADVLDRPHNQRCRIREALFEEASGTVMLELEGYPVAAAAKKLEKKLQWACRLWKVDFRVIGGKEECVVKHLDP